MDGESGDYGARPRLFHYNSLHISPRVGTEPEEINISRSALYVCLYIGATCVISLISIHYSTVDSEVSEDDVIGVVSCMCAGFL